MASEGLGVLCRVLCLCLADRRKGPERVACPALRGRPTSGGSFLSTFLWPRCSCLATPPSREGWEVSCCCELRRKEDGFGQWPTSPHSGLEYFPVHVPRASPSQRGVPGVHLPLNLTSTDYRSKQNLRRIKSGISDISICVFSGFIVRLDTVSSVHRSILRFRL